MKQNRHKFLKRRMCRRNKIIKSSGQRPLYRWRHFGIQKCCIEHVSESCEGAGSTECRTKYRRIHLTSAALKVTSDDDYVMYSCKTTRLSVTEGCHLHVIRYEGISDNILTEANTSTTYEN
jgi:hypothetical protein